MVGLAVLSACQWCLAGDRYDRKSIKSPGLSPGTVSDRKYLNKALVVKSTEVDHVGADGKRPRMRLQSERCAQ